MDAMGCSDLGKVSVCSAVHIGDGDDVRTGCERLKDGSGGSGARGKGQGVFGVLESRDGLLKVITGVMLASERLRRPVETPHSPIGV